MAVFNSSTRELVLKIVYYGPALCGKTTNLEYVYSQMPDDKKGKMLSLATESDRTLFFDFLPLDLGKIQNWNIRIQLYTVPGQVFYDATRRLVLKGADGIVFVADSQREMLEANVESLKNMKENLRANGLDYQTIPLVLQFNKRDLKDILPVEEMNAALNDRQVPFFEAIAIHGDGVMETLKEITRRTIAAVQYRITGERPAAAETTQVERTESETAELSEEEIKETLSESTAFEHLPETYDQIEELEPIEEITEIEDLEEEFEDLTNLGKDFETSSSEETEEAMEKTTHDSIGEQESETIEETNDTASSTDALILDSDTEAQPINLEAQAGEIKVERTADGFQVTIVLKLNIKIE